MIRYDQKSGISPVITSSTLNANGRAEQQRHRRPGAAGGEQRAGQRSDREHRGGQAEQAGAGVEHLTRDISALVTWKFMPNVATKKISTMVIHSAGRSLT